MTDTDLFTALAAAQGEMKNAGFDSQNPHFKNQYASLAAVRDAVIPALSAHGIALTQTTVLEPFHLVTTLHKGEQTHSSYWPLTIAKPQEMGSQLTYARRYSLLAICGINGDVDDDAETGNTAPPKPGAKARAAAVEATAPAPLPDGYLGKTALQQALKALAAAVAETKTIAYLDDLIDHEYAKVIEQAKAEDHPWWFLATPAGGPSISGRIDAKRADLLITGEVDPDDEERKAIQEAG